jgi:ArsR family transcriptional regulator, virulence genes transcriptional regulator
MKISPLAMDAAAEQASELLKSLANRHRLMIVCQLIEGEQSVGGMADYLGIRDSTVSQHLALLRKDGVVSARRDGQTIWYSIASGPAQEILKTLYRIYCGPRPICEPDTITPASAAQKRKRIKRNDRPQPSPKSHATRRP